MKREEIHIGLNDLTFPAILTVPEDARSLVIFAHGSGSSHLSSRNNFVADLLNNRNMATLLADLLTVPEDEVYENRFNIPLLSNRLVKITEWALQQTSLQHFPVGYFGASTGAAAALRAAALLDDNIRAVVSRGGRPDLANHALQKVKAPTLLIVGSLDVQVAGLNQKAYEELKCEKKMEFVQGASHLFEEPGTLHRAAVLAADWFERHLLTVGHSVNRKIDQN
jgi:pimeloyl-ACP methyl ester carboxylesterase